MDLNLFRQDIKKICLLRAYLQSLKAAKKPLKNVGKNSICLIPGASKAIFQLFLL